jgi:hypothetical protein
MKMENNQSCVGANYRLACQKFTERRLILINSLPSGGILRLVKENNSKILGIETAKQGSLQKFDSQAVSSLLKA